MPPIVRNLFIGLIKRKGGFGIQAVLQRPTCVKSLCRVYCSTSLPYQPEEVAVEFRNGFPTVNVMLPSRDERCLFTLRPLTDTVSTFLSMISNEDKGVETVAIYKKDGTKIAKATTIDILLSEDFDLIINSRKFSVAVPEMVMGGSEKKGAAEVKDLITQLYTQMNLNEWQASREQELQASVEKIQHELAPYEKLYAEMTENSEKRMRRLTWLGLGLMGVQFGFLARLTWWEYSWDIMEPVTYFVTYGTSMAMFAYYVVTKQDYVFPDIKDRAFLLHFHKLAKKNSYDIEHYNNLIKKLGDAQNDLDKIRKPIGLALPESELQSLLHKGKPNPK